MAATKPTRSPTTAAAEGDEGLAAFGVFGRQPVVEAGGFVQGLALLTGRECLGTDVEAGRGQGVGHPSAEQFHDVGVRAEEGAAGWGDFLHDLAGTGEDVAADDDAFERPLRKPGGGARKSLTHGKGVREVRGGCLGVVGAASGLDGVWGGCPEDPHPDPLPRGEGGRGATPSDGGLGAAGCVVRHGPAKDSGPAHHERGWGGGGCPEDPHPSPLPEGEGARAAALSRTTEREARFSQGRD